MALSYKMLPPKGGVVVRWKLKAELLDPLAAGLPGTPVATQVEQYRMSPKMGEFPFSYL
jgi:hypothetical protein